jgi:phytoene dehydrogenase-like protein
MTTVDAVVIGAGHNGLVAANLLADAGWDVLVLEAESAPGGAVRSAEITAPGFLSDLCSAFYPLGAASPVLRRLELERYGLTWRHAPAVLAHILPDGRCAVLHRDEDRTAESLAQFDKADAAAWHAECARWRRLSPALLDALFAPFPPVRRGARLAREFGVADGLRFARFGVQPLRRFAEERFGGEGARALLGGNALHTDLGPESAGSAVFGWLLAMVGQQVGFPVPAGGAGALTGALVDRLVARGGRVECRRPVERILVAGGRALGVRDAGGGLIRARRAVLADVAAPTLYGDLLDPGQLPSRFRADLRDFRWDNDVVKVDWALDSPVPWTAEPARTAGTVHLGADLDGLTGYAADLARGKLPGNPFVLIGQMTTADPTRSPAGTESLWAYTHVPRGRTWTQASAGRYADRVEKLIERHAPGFRGRIQARAVAAPGVGGHGQVVVNGGTAGVYQQLVFRPVPGLGRADTPVDRLYLAGASAHPGGGVHGGPGANAAAAALARAGVFGGVYATGIKAAHRAIYR